MNRPQQPAPASKDIAHAANTPPAQPASGRRYDLARFTLADMVRCGSALRLLVSQSASAEEGAQKVTRFLYDGLRDKTSGRRSCVLVRLFRTLPYARLAKDLRTVADSIATAAVLKAETNCLTLLASAGDEPQWNSRRSSKGHQAIPLISEAMVEQFPMIAQLIRQLGMATTDLLQGKPEIIQELNQRSFGVFHVPAAPGSPFVPAQTDFVMPYQIASVLGSGGMLPDGDLFVLILFARIAIPASTAEMFRTIALNLKLGFLAVLENPVFAD
jgi:hypothetical protein